MLHFTFMGGAEVRLREQDNIVITVMGGTEIKMPTLAEKIITWRRLRKEHGANLENAARHTHVITFIGGTITKIPTLGREIEELFQLRESGMMSNDELSELWYEVLEGSIDVIENLTIMGGAGDETPNKKEEIAAIDRLILTGILSGEEAQELKNAIESKNFIGFKSEIIQKKIRNLLLPPGLYTLSTSRNPLSKSNQLE
jgi:hypothetical protein